MKKTISLLSAVLCMAIFTVSCKTTPPVTESSLNIPSLSESSYKSINTQQKPAALYLYHSQLGALHTKNGDMTMKVIMDTLGSKFSYYKVDLKTFSSQGSAKLQMVLGGNKLPAYIFIYKNNIAAKLTTAYDNREAAQQAADSLKQGFRSILR